MGLEELAISVIGTYHQEFKEIFDISVKVGVDRVGI